MAIYPLGPKAGSKQGSHSNVGGLSVEVGSDHLPFHAQSTEGALLNLASSLQGLSETEAAARHAALGSEDRWNDPGATDAKTAFLGAAKKRMMLLFLAAAGVSFYMGTITDGLLILVAMLANIGVQGLIQWKSMRSQVSLATPEDSRCLVRRDGQSQSIQAGEIVPGDILLIESGQIIPADARLLSSYQVQADESLLTGESVLVPKQAAVILHPAEDVTAQANMLFAGTVVKTGKGEAVVTALAKRTVMGRIAAIACNTEKRESPFTRRLNKLSLKVSILVALLAAGVIAIGHFYQVPMPRLIQLGLVMMIAGFPETVPALASLILSLGISRLNERKVLVKNFQALETIADISVICTDKTGTLTENYLTFDQLFLPELGAVNYDPRWQKGEAFPSRSVEECLRVGRLNNGTVVEGLRSPLMGDPIDVALFRAAPASLEAGYHARMTLPFDPVKLRSAVLCETRDGRMLSMIKGAPEAIMEICRYYMRPDGEIAEITLTQRSEFLMFNRKLAYDNSMRIIGFAQKPLASGDNDPYHNAVFLGWVCLLDPPKPGVVETIAQLQQTGGHMIMITGDQKATAEVTARELGIMKRKSDEIWLRSDLEVLGDHTVAGRIPASVKVFARTRPEEKLAIVESLQRSGQTVAMVGDGVNDSPALQKSDVAIAMGLQGAEAAKDSADIILLNDRLEGIMQAILESRILRRKVHTCIRYLLSCNLGLLLFGTALTALGHAESLNVVQILWLNLITTLIPALVIAIEPVPDSELQPPACPAETDEPEARESYIDKYKRLEAEEKAAQQEAAHHDPLYSGHLFLMGYWGVMIMAAGLGGWLIGSFGLKLPTEGAGTVAFCSVAFAQALNLFNVQALAFSERRAGERRNTFLAELGSTPMTWIVIVLALLMQAATVYIPVLGQLMGTVPLPPIAASVAVALGGSAILFSLKTTRF